MEQRLDTSYQIPGLTPQESARRIAAIQGAYDDLRDTLQSRGYNVSHLPELWVTTSSPLNATSRVQMKYVPIPGDDRIYFTTEALSRSSLTPAMIGGALAHELDHFYRARPHYAPRGTDRPSIQEMSRDLHAQEVIPAPRLGWNHYRETQADLFAKVLDQGCTLAAAIEEAGRANLTHARAILSAPNRDPRLTRDISHGDYRAIMADDLETLRRSVTWSPDHLSIDQRHQALCPATLPQARSQAASRRVTATNTPQ